jgi:hypothetical protein
MPRAVPGAGGHDPERDPRPGEHRRRRADAAVPTGDGDQPGSSGDGVGDGGASGGGGRGRPDLRVDLPAGPDLRDRGRDERLPARRVGQAGGPGSDDEERRAILARVGRTARHQGRGVGHVGHGSSDGEA